MLKGLYRLVTVFLVLACLFTSAGITTAATDDEIREQLRRAQQEAEAEQRRLDQLRREKDAKQGEVNRYTRELNEAEQTLYHYSHELSGLENDMFGVQLQVDATRSDLTNMQAHLDERSHLMNTRLRVLSEMGTLSYLEVLLSATSFTDFISRFDYLSSLLTKDIKIMKEVRGLRDQIADRQADLDAQRQELATLRAETERKRAHVASIADEVAGYKDQASADLELLEELEAELTRVADHWNDVIWQLQRQLNRKAKDGLAFDWPLRGLITSQFGPRPDPFTGVWTNHSGLDVAVPSGTPIGAAEDGVVIYSGWIDGYGYTIIIDHGGGISSLYGHASKLIAQTGQEVLQGDTVALVGSTGYSTGPHLHFEVRVNGTRVDPEDWLP